MESVDRVLDKEGATRDAAYVWTRHRWFAWFAGMSFVAVVVLAPVGGIESWPTRIVLGLAAVAVASLATTDYRVVADTTDGMFVLRASRIRQIATAMDRRVEGNAQIEPVGGTILYTDWQVGDMVFTAPRSSQTAMERMAARY